MTPDPKPEADLKANREEDRYASPQTYQELTFAEDALRSVIDTAPALLYSGSPDGNLDYLNRRWLEYLGVPLEQVCGWGWTSFIHPDDAVDAKTVDAKTGIGTVRYPRLEARDADCAAQLKKRTLTELYNKRQKGDGDAAWLDFAHKKLDAAVAAAYGWPADLSDEQILEKLLALNLERAAEEAKSAVQTEHKTPV